MRPLDIDDLNVAILRCCEMSASSSSTYELVGPEVISYRNLILKTAALMGKRVEIGSIPIWVARLGAAISSRLKGGGITPTVLDVITADEVVTQNADVALNISHHRINALQTALLAVRPQQRTLTRAQNAINPPPHITPRAAIKTRASFSRQHCPIRHSTRICKDHARLGS